MIRLAGLSSSYEGNVTVQKLNITLPTVGIESKPRCVVSQLTTDYIAQWNIPIL